MRDSYISVHVVRRILSSNCMMEYMSTNVCNGIYISLQHQERLFSEVTQEFTCYIKNLQEVENLTKTQDSALYLTSNILESIQSDNIFSILKDISNISSMLFNFCLEV